MNLELSSVPCTGAEDLSDGSVPTVYPLIITDLQPTAIVSKRRRKVLQRNKRKDEGRKEKGNTSCTNFMRRCFALQIEAAITIEPGATELKQSLLLLQRGIWNAAFSSSETTCTKRHAYMRVDECLLMYVGLFTCNCHDTRQFLLHTQQTKLSISAVFSFII